ncbi:hypothetical protein SBY92_003466 [Candida maltosa Xu316]
MVNNRQLNTLTCTSQQSYSVTLKLSKDILHAVQLSQVKIKSPTKKQQISSQREGQITQYNVLRLKEERESRHSKRRSTGGLESPTPSPKKKVKFSI